MRLCTIVPITRCPVRHWRITATADRDRSREVLPAVACRGATSRSAPATPSSLRRPCGGSPGGPGGRRPVRGVKSEEGKSGLQALRPPSPRIRHQAYGPAGYRHDSELSFGASTATASSSAPSPEGPIFHADEPRGPRRACAVGWESGADPRPPGKPPPRTCRKRANDSRRALRQCRRQE